MHKGFCPGFLPAQQGPQQRGPQIWQARCRGTLPARQPLPGYTWAPGFGQPSGGVPGVTPSAAAPAAGAAGGREDSRPWSHRGARQGNANGSRPGRGTASAGGASLTQDEGAAVRAPHGAPHHPVGTRQVPLESVRHRSGAVLDRHVPQVVKVQGLSAGGGRGRMVAHSREARCGRRRLLRCRTALPFRNQALGAKWPARHGWAAEPRL